jgi:beta-lactam-binding protein with PASTA domain
MKLLITALALSALVGAFTLGVGGRVEAAQGAAPSASVVMPKVVGMRMDRATRTLQQRGLRVNEECSGLFGCIVKSRWVVCHQSPAAGKRLQRYTVVVIYGERRGEC